MLLRREVSTKGMMMVGVIGFEPRDETIARG